MNDDERELNLLYLQAELARIDVNIRRLVRSWQLAGQSPMDPFRGLRITDEEAIALSKRPLGVGWGHMVALPPDEERTFAQAAAQAARQVKSLAAGFERRRMTPRLDHLVTAFGLTSFDRDALLICLAPSLDLRYERIYGYLQDDVTRRRPRVNLVLDLLCPPGGQRLPMMLRFADGAPLIASHLLERVPAPAEHDSPPLLGQVLRVDETVVSWLLGEYRPRAEMGESATLLVPQDVDSVLVKESEPLLERALSLPQAIVVMCGRDALAARTAAHLLAAREGRPILSVNLADLGDVSPIQGVRLALRDALLTDALPFISGWDACLEGNSLPAALEAVCAHPGRVIVAGQTPWQATGIERDRTFIWIEFPIPSFAQRRRLWTRLAGCTPDEAEALAGRFALTAAQIRDAAATARDMAVREGCAVEHRHLAAAARTHSSPGLARLARKIKPRYTWKDIVLPPDQQAMLHELVATVRARPLVLEGWGIGAKLVASAGITALFSGPPGTGKTMAAEIIANDLGLDLFKIDLSTVVSKYVGETEKNLERIFGEAEHSNAILFFDEADALFGKRSEVKDAHDRYANVEIGYLLQRMESYEGVTILATNLRANLDEAFTRRLRFAIDFPFPDAEYRLRIWQTLFPPGVPRAPDLDFELLARRFKLAGGSIRNIIVSAAYLAAADGGVVAMKHLLHGARRELQKMGRLVHEADLVIEKATGLS